MMLCVVCVQMVNDLERVLSSERVTDAVCVVCSDGEPLGERLGIDQQ